MSTRDTPDTADETDRQTTADHDAREPVNTVRVSDSLRRFIIDECVICGETHHHGSLDATVATGGRSHRGAHCRDVSHTGGYYLELDDDAEPPERWYSWVDRESGIEVTPE